MRYLWLQNHVIGALTSIIEENFNNNGEKTYQSNCNMFYDPLYHKLSDSKTIRVTIDAICGLWN